MNQPWIYMYSPSQSSLPPPSPPEKPLISFERDSPSWTLFPSEVPKSQFPIQQPQWTFCRVPRCLSSPSQGFSDSRQNSEVFPWLRRPPGSARLPLYHCVPALSLTLSWLWSDLSLVLAWTEQAGFHLATSTLVGIVCLTYPNMALSSWMLPLLFLNTV